MATHAIFSNCLRTAFSDPENVSANEIVRSSKPLSLLVNPDALDLTGDRHQHLPHCGDPHAAKPRTNRDLMACGLLLSGDFRCHSSALSMYLIFYWRGRRTYIRP
ncbi:hypothetical protein, partial [Paraburkholderia youngii]